MVREGQKAHLLHLKCKKGRERRDRIQKLGETRRGILRFCRSSQSFFYKVTSTDEQTGCLNVTGGNPATTLGPNLLGVCGYYMLTANARV